MKLEADTKVRSGGLGEVSGPRPGRGQRLLVVDDDEYVRHLLASALRFAGFVVDVCEDGRAALDRVVEMDPALVLLDVMMPDLDGVEVCRRLRASGLATPVIFVTARDASEDKVTGLTQGGDDYVTKPFDLDELVARIDAVLKRTSPPVESSLRRHEYADIVVDDDAHRAWLGSELLALSPTEYRLLRFLVMHAERVATKAQILADVWGYDYVGSTGVVETYVFYLRRKLGPDGPAMIQTVRGIGYTLRVE